MQKYDVTIEELVVGTFDIYANSEDEALDIASNKYRNKEIMLEPGEVHSKRMAILSSDKEETWYEL